MTLCLNAFYSITLCLCSLWLQALCKLFTSWISDFILLTPETPSLYSILFYKTLPISLHETLCLFSITPWNPVSVLYHSMKPCACSLSLHETLCLFSLTPWYSVSILSHSMTLCLSLSLCSRPPALTGRHSVSVRCPPLCSSQLMLSCVWAFQTIKYL